MVGRFAQGEREERSTFVVERIHLCENGEREVRLYFSRRQTPMDEIIENIVDLSRGKQYIQLGIGPMNTAPHIDVRQADVYRSRRRVHPREYLVSGWNASSQVSPGMIM